jgi:hypothetical protein
MLVVFDIDGTLANIDHRIDFVRMKPKDWKAFDAGIPRDSINDPVARVFDAMVSAGHGVILVSGRSDRTRQVTQDWLSAKSLTGYLRLYMRSDGDYRADDIVKRDILDQVIADFGKKPDMVFDDRPRVVNMWRDQGIFVFDVYQGKDDF